MRHLYFLTVACCTNERVSKAIIPTANVIKKRISNCKGLSYIATRNIINSKWCPWELGLADGMLNGKSCILPVMEESSTFKGLNI